MSEQTSSTRPCTSEWGGEGLGPDSAAEKGWRTWAGTCGGATGGGRSLDQGEGILGGGGKASRVHSSHSE